MTEPRPTRSERGVGSKGNFSMPAKHFLATTAVMRAQAGESTETRSLRQEVSFLSLESTRGGQLLEGITSMASDDDDQRSDQNRQASKLSFRRRESTAAACLPRSLEPSPHQIISLANSSLRFDLSLETSQDCRFRIRKADADRASSVHSRWNKIARAATPCAASTSVPISRLACVIWL